MFHPFSLSFMEMSSKGKHSEVKHYLLLPLAKLYVMGEKGRFLRETVYICMAAKVKGR